MFEAVVNLVSPQIRICQTEKSFLDTFLIKLFFFLRQPIFSDFKKISVGFLEILLGCNLRCVRATECARARPFMWFWAQRAERKRLAVFLSSSHCRVTHSAGSTVIRGKKTFHISVSPTALLRASQQGPTHLFFQPSSLLLSSYSSLCCCLALSHSDLMSGVVLNKSFSPPLLCPEGTESPCFYCQPQPSPH